MQMTGPWVGVIVGFIRRREGSCQQHKVKDFGRKKKATEKRENSELLRPHK